MVSEAPTGVTIIDPSLLDIPPLNNSICFFVRNAWVSLSVPYTHLSIHFYKLPKLLRKHLQLFSSSSSDLWQVGRLTTGQTGKWMSLEAALNGHMRSTGPPWPPGWKTSEACSTVSPLVLWCTESQLSTAMICLINAHFIGFFCFVFLLYSLIRFGIMLHRLFLHSNPMSVSASGEAKSRQTLKGLKFTQDSF